ncbi:hypothetical protein SUGI_0010460 [Cryptomeria japonica]|nr:hypothetical protein SUGI_0010460 [Cryptomeria japonica]
MLLKFTEKIDIFDFIFTDMGQFVSCSKLPDVNDNYEGTIKIVDSSGLVKEYLPPIVANDILIDYPKHFIFNAKDLQVCNPRPMTAEDKLVQGNVYFLFRLTTPKLKGDDEQTILVICDTPNLQMDYINLLLTKSKSRSWRSHLGTIDESSFAV